MRLLYFLLKLDKLCERAYFTRWNANKPEGDTMFVLVIVRACKHEYTESERQIAEHEKICRSRNRRNCGVELATPEFETFRTTPILKLLQDELQIQKLADYTIVSKNGVKFFCSSFVLMLRSKGKHVQNYAKMARLGLISPIYHVSV